MRELKFRAWDTSKKIMFSAEEMGIDQEALLPDGRGFANIWHEMSIGRRDVWETMTC